MASVRTLKKYTIELNLIALEYLAKNYQEHTQERIPMPVSEDNLRVILAQFQLHTVNLTRSEWGAFCVDTNDDLQALHENLLAMPEPAPSAPPEDSDDEANMPELTEAVLAQHIAAGGGATALRPPSLRFFGTDENHTSRSSSVREETPIEPLQKLLISHLNAIFTADGKSLTFIGKLRTPLESDQSAADKISDFMAIIRKSWGISLGRSRHFNSAIQTINAFTTETLKTPAQLQLLIAELKEHKDLANYQPSPLPMNPSFDRAEGGGYNL